MSIVYLQLISIPVVGDVSSTVSRSLCESQDLIDLIFQRCSNSMCIYIYIYRGECWSTAVFHTRRKKLFISVVFAKEKKKESMQFMRHENHKV
jgi:hypothetical protein